MPMLSKCLQTWRQSSDLTRWMAVATVAHLLLMLAFWPDVITNTDEAGYVEAAMAFADGERRGTRVDIETLQSFRRHISLYPVGTSVSQVLPIWLFGWRGAFVVPIAGFLATLWGGVALVRRTGGDPWLGLVPALFLPILVLSRVATSDDITSAMVVLALYSFLRGTAGQSNYFLLSGLTAGLLLAFREATTLVVAPLFVGAVLRRDAGWWKLVAGGVVGTAIRLASAQFVYGDPLFRHPGYGTFTVSSLIAHMPFYLVISLVVLPGGLWAVLRYRGWRAPEVVVGAMAYMLLHAAYQYGASESGGPNAIVIGGRYLAPAVPLFAIAMATWVQQWSDQGQAAPSWQQSLLRHKGRILGGVLVLGALVHPAMHLWSRNHAAIVQDIQIHIPAKSRVIMGTSTLLKAFASMHVTRPMIDVALVSPAQVASWRNSGTPLFVALLARNDSTAYVAGAKEQDRELARILTSQDLELVHTHDMDWQVLKIWRVRPLPSGE